MAERTDDSEGWHSISGESHHMMHWHFGPEDADNWASITASNNGSIGGFYDDKWTVEYYGGEAPCERLRADNYAEMLRKVAKFMETHD